MEKLLKLLITLENVPTFAPFYFRETAKKPLKLFWIPRSRKPQ
jgi:hypothetical protein